MAKQYDGTITVSVPTVLYPEDVVNNANKTQVLGFIIDIDNQIAEWDFTLALYEHFKALKEKHDQDEALLRA